VVKRPKVLLADEPTGNLDESTRDEIMEVLETLWKEHGLTFIMVTHDSALAKKAPRVATIRGAHHGEGERRGVRCPRRRAPHGVGRLGVESGARAGRAWPRVRRFAPSREACGTS
jgi:ABC-type nitrate/sulfonate/bicarbonate transport system ATPase subunit